MFKSCSTTFLPELSARDSLKVANEGSFTGKKVLKFSIFKTFL